MDKKKIILSAIILLFIVVSINIYTVSNKQNKLFAELEEKRVEITQIRSQGDLNSRYPKIIQYNWLANDYNTCVKVFPNNIYNNLFLSKESVDYLIK